MKNYRILILNLILLITISCSKSVKNEIVVALVNNEPVFEREMVCFKRINKIQFKSIEQGELTQEEIINSIVERKLILQESKKLNINVTDKEVEKELKATNNYSSNKDFMETLRSNLIDFNDWRKHIREQMLIERVLTVKSNGNEISDKDISNYYYAHLKDFTHTEMVRAYQILVKTLTEIQEVKKALDLGESFEKLAERKSISPEASKGGDLGYFTREEMPPEITDVTFNLAVGKISDIVKTNYGYHIFKVVDKKKKGTKSLKEVSNEIKEKLRLNRQDRFFKNWIKEVRKNAVVKINKNYMEKER